MLSDGIPCYFNLLNFIRKILWQGFTKLDGAVYFIFSFYPAALKGCQGIVFTHGVQMGGRWGGRREKVCPGCISETVRCRKLILGRDIGKEV